MPVSIKKKGSGCYSVSTPNQTHAKCTSKKNAERQRNLLNAVDHGWHPTGKPARENLSAEEIVNQLLD